ncbi:zinc finger protein 64 [Eurytemora carolleeae]|uniref:zinc finger protein 64 n=1 Tax=Eurytemora carolleeae TaxID=1294199 RepID=UPI000C78E559|nr:zinc finger protein 64 [Eurytemora carolleeae]|eukprot:XP_023342558.1 zinc finger protein 64-like [Eurytemora affinis]
MGILYCAVRSCTSNSSYSGLRFFSFPKELDSAWTKVVDREDWVPKKNSKICSLHFRTRDITGRHIRQGAIPYDVSTYEHGEKPDKEESEDGEPDQCSQEDTGEVCEEVGQGNTEEDDDDDEGIERIEFVQEMEVEGDDESDDDERTERREEGEVGRNIEYRGVMIEDEEEEDMEEEYIEIKSSSRPIFEYTCNLCQMNAKSKSGHWYNKKRRTQNPYYPCDMCKFVESTLEEWSEDKERETAVECDQCEYTAETLEEMKQHMERIHSSGRKASSSALKRKIPESVLRNSAVSIISLPGSAVTVSTLQHSVISNSALSLYSSQSSDSSLPTLPAVSISAIPTSPSSDRSISPDLAPRTGYPNSAPTIIGVFPCSECNFISTSRDNIARHMQVVHGVMTQKKTFPCPITECEYIAEDSTSLRRHTQTKHEGLRFPCDLCDFFATRKSTLKTHIKSIHEGVKYPCEVCAYAATQKSALKRHMNTVHNPNKLATRFRKYHEMPPNTSLGDITIIP